jgi:hypothetical protein
MPTQSIENVSRKLYTSTALSRYIVVDGQLIKAGKATDEEFYCYVYSLLEQFYAEEMKEEKEIIEWRYRETFDIDWSDDDNRVAAINEFNGMNRARRTCRLPLIPLFAEGAR